MSKSKNTVPVNECGYHGGCSELARFHVVPADKDYHVDDYSCVRHLGNVLAYYGRDEYGPNWEVEQIA